MLRAALFVARLPAARLAGVRMMPHAGGVGYGIDNLLTEDGCALMLEDGTAIKLE